jgi:L-threonylcarbamoyladenylate synthase
VRTRVLSIDPLDPDPAVVSAAASTLRAGGLVAFPTETVYGLGANATDAAAVARVFTAKGRPSRNPLIVHVADEADARALASSWPPAAAALAARLWPGPLTLVAQDAGRVASAVTAGGDTVALRVPAHPVALALLRACALPIAAPSANRSSHVSPTRGEHVRADLEGRVDLILDAGPTPGGIESTVLDVTVDPPRILRPGLVTPAAIAAVLHRAPSSLASDGGPSPSRQPGALRSPGLLSRHYAPRARLILAGGDAPRLAAELRRAGSRVGLVTAGTAAARLPGVETTSLPLEPAAYARGLYAALRELDGRGVDIVVVETPPEGEAWMAVHDRLRRASASGGVE